MTVENAIEVVGTDLGIALPCHAEAPIYDPDLGDEDVIDAIDNEE